MQIELSVHGDVQVSRQILRVGDRAIDAEPAFETIAETLMQIEGRQFASEGAYASGGWAQLAESTLEQKQGPRILDETGVLRRSLTERGAEHQILITAAEFMTFGTDLDYAGFHQRGTSRMPQRRPVELRETDRRHAVRQLQSWVLTGELLGSGPSGFEQLAGELD